MPELGEKLGRYAQQKLAERGVEICPRTKVTGYIDSLVTISSGEAIPAATLIWTAGVTLNPVIAQLPCKKEKGRIMVDEFLEVPGFVGLWAMGDCAAVPDAKTGGPQPPTAQHALRQARHAAKNIEAVLAGRQKKPFRFSTIGQLASIGHRHGVANILGMNFSGFIAWLLWRSVYLLKLPRLAKKTRVALSWLLEMIFSKDLEQMLTLRDVELIRAWRRHCATTPPNKCNRRSKDVDKNSSERCLVNGADIVDLFARESRREPGSGGA